MRRATVSHEGWEGVSVNLTWALINAGCPDGPQEPALVVREGSNPYCCPDPCVAYCGQLSLHGPPIITCSCTVGLALSWLEDSKT